MYPIYVQGGFTYNEQLTIGSRFANLENLGLIGVNASGHSYSGPDLLLAGAGPDAPVLQGDNISSSREDTGITVYAQGFTFIGFVIENFDTAIFQSVISGSNTVDISNTSIRDNVDGIRDEKDQGSPSTQIHHTLFQGNTGLDLINNAGSNNQYIYAQMNYWGCDSAPVVLHHHKKVGGNWISGDYYVDWMSKTEIADDTPRVRERSLQGLRPALWE